jgi:hypothetical protein
MAVPGADERKKDRQNSRLPGLKVTVATYLTPLMTVGQAGV